MENREEIQLIRLQDKCKELKKEKEKLQNELNKLVVLNEDLKKFVNKLKTGDCWCECGIDNPMMQGEHSELCKEMQEYKE